MVFPFLVQCAVAAGDGQVALLEHIHEDGQVGLRADLTVHKHRHHRGRKVAGEHGQTRGTLGVVGGGPAGFADADGDEEQGEQAKGGKPERPIENIGGARPICGGEQADEAGLRKDPGSSFQLGVGASTRPWGKYKPTVNCSSLDR